MGEAAMKAKRRDIRRAFGKDAVDLVTVQHAALQDHAKALDSVMAVLTDTRKSLERLADRVALLEGRPELYGEVDRYWRETAAATESLVERLRWLLWAR